MDSTLWMNSYVPERVTLIYFQEQEYQRVYGDFVKFSLEVVSSIRKFKEYAYTLLDSRFSKTLEMISFWSGSALFTASQDASIGITGEDRDSLLKKGRENLIKFLSIRNKKLLDSSSNLMISKASYWEKAMPKKTLKRVYIDIVNEKKEKVGSYFLDLTKFNDHILLNNNDVLEGRVWKQPMNLSIDCLKKMEADFFKNEDILDFRKVKELD